MVRRESPLLINSEFARGWELVKDQAAAPGTRAARKPARRGAARNRHG